MPKTTAVTNSPERPARSRETFRPRRGRAFHMDLATLTDNEFNVLSALWERGLTVSALAEAIYGRRGDVAKSVKHSQENSVKKALERLEAKDYASRINRGVLGNPFIHYAILTKEDLAVLVLDNLAKLIGEPAVKAAIRRRREQATETV